MDSMSPIHVGDLRTIPARYERGIGDLEQHIQLRDRVFCVCATARDYHVGVADTKQLIDRSRVHYERHPLNESPEGWVYVPASPTSPSDEINTLIERARDDLLRVYDTLSTAYPAYVTGTPLREQSSVQPTFARAFRRLREQGVISATTQNALFNHQGITLLMEMCFTDRADFIRYLSDPECLTGGSA